MMIEKTDAIVLRVSPFSKTSHVVLWLTPDHGKLSTVVKGACRPKSDFLGQYDLFYTCEVLFYAREHEGLHILKECSPFKMRRSLRVDWRGAACASYLSDLVSRISVSGGNHRTIYDFVDSTLDFLCSHNCREQVLFWAELKLSHILGLSPLLNRCAKCANDLSEQLPSRFSPVHGGVLCTDCARATGQAVCPLSAPTLAILRQWQSSSSPRAAINTRYGSAQITEFDELLGMFLNYHLELGIMPSSRKIAIEMLTYPQAPVHTKGTR